LAIFSWPVLRRKKKGESKSQFRFKVFLQKESIATAEQIQLFTYAKYFSEFKLEVTFSIIKSENGTKQYPAQYQFLSHFHRRRHFSLSVLTKDFHLQKEFSYL